MTLLTRGSITYKQETYLKRLIRDTIGDLPEWVEKFRDEMRI